MKENYQAQLEELINSIPDGKRPSLLLHSCCGPCSTYVLTYLERYFDITVYFYNPNIMPESEYTLRLAAQEEVIAALPFQKTVQLEVPPYDYREFLEISQGLENEPERGMRCRRCIELRIKKTAEYAALNGFDYFCTTLSVSPHKDAVLLNTLSKQYANTYKIAALPADFKKKNGFLSSTRLSKELGIYRQNYCGCIFSKQNEQ